MLRISLMNIFKKAHVFCVSLSIYIAFSGNNTGEVIFDKWMI